MIFESQLIEATNTDAMAGGRLNSIPYGGMLYLKFLADLATAAARFVLTIQLPNGDVPVNAQVVWASSSAADMVMDERETMDFAFAVGQGGHVTVSLTETGTAVVGFVAVLR